MVLAGILVQSLSPSLVGFDLSIISRIRLLKSVCQLVFVLDKSFVRRRYLLTSRWGGGDSHMNFKFNP